MIKIKTLKRTERHLTNGVFDIPKAKLQSIFDSKPRELCKSAREFPHFFNTTMSEAKETIIIEDEPEDDDTEELYQSVFITTEETCPIAR